MASAINRGRGPEDAQNRVEIGRNYQLSSRESEESFQCTKLSARSARSLIQSQGGPAASPPMGGMRRVDAGDRRLRRCRSCALPNARPPDEDDRLRPERKRVEGACYCAASATCAVSTPTLSARISAMSR